MINYRFLSNTALFQGLSEKEIKGILQCLLAASKEYGKNDTVYRIGDTVTSMGLVLSGSVNIIQNDVWGNQSILEHIGPGQVFAETYACMKGEPLMVNVVAAEDTEILFLHIDKMLSSCSENCEFHTRLIHNLLFAMAAKNLSLTRKIHHISPRSNRERLLSYLSFQAVKQGKYTFDIPFNRQQLADYLSMERSALSNELSKMQKDGLITYEKNRFVLHCDTL